MVVDEPEREVLGQLLHLLNLAREVQHVALLQHQCGRCQLLVYRAHKLVVSGTTAQFDDVHAIFTVDVKVDDGLVDDLRGLVHMYTEQILRQSILLHQFAQRLSALLAALFARFRCQEHLRQRHQHQYAYHQCDDTHRQEGEERYVGQRCRHQSIRLGIR